MPWNPPHIKNNPSDPTSTQEVALKIAISAEGPDLEAKAGNRLGTARYLIVVDLATMKVEAVPNPGGSGQSGAGIQAVALAISKKVNTLLTGYCSPTAKSYLSANAIEVITGVHGTAAEVVEQFKRGNLRNYTEVMRESESIGGKVDKLTLLHTLRSSWNQFINLLPILVGVVLLMGLFNAFVSKALVSFLFSGNKALDTFLGACLGSILAGNPINSYIIGGELLEFGVSLFAVTALIIAWVTVGLIQLPAEIAAMGRRFALVRNAVSFILSIAIAIITVAVLSLIKG